MSEPAPFGTFRPRGFARRAIAFGRSLPDNWLGRRGVILTRRLAARPLGTGPVDIEALGVRLRVLPTGNICEKRMLFAPDTFDRAEREILADRLHPKFVFLDIGANVGAYALFVAGRAGPTARILAVEPQPDVFERLVVNIGLNAFATVKALDCAIADKSGEVTLFVDPRNSGESSVKIVTSGGARPLRVAARSLLDLVSGEGLTRIDALKLDVEGAEDLILEPFLRDADPALLPRLLIIENGGDRWGGDLLAALAASGYARRLETRMNLVLERNPDGAAG